MAPDGSVELNREAVDSYGIPPHYIEGEAERLKHVIRRRYEDYRGDPTPPNLKGKIAIVVDDGIATGFTTQAAIHYIRRQKPKKIVLAVPVSARDSYEKLKPLVDELICLGTPSDFYAVGQFYETFNQVEDKQAKKLLAFR